MHVRMDQTLLVMIQSNNSKPSSIYAIRDPIKNHATYPLFKDVWLRKIRSSCWWGCKYEV